MSLLQTLATSIDNLGWRKRRRAFRTGWAASSCADLQFHDTALTQYRYRVREAGRPGAPTIVFAADPPATLELYDDLLTLFSQSFRVVVLEVPAMGFSVPHSGFGYGFRETSDDLAEFLSAVAGDGAVLAFSCAVGLAAVDIAVRHPNLVSQLTLLQTTDWAGFQRWKAARDPKRILAKPILGQLAMRRLAKQRMPDWYALSLGNRAKHGEFCACAKNTMDRGAGWPLASAYQNFIYDGDSPLGTATQPMLLLWGSADRSHDDKAADTANNLGTNVTVRRLAGLGHFPELEDPVAVYPIIQEFVAQHSMASNTARSIS